MWLKKLKLNYSNGLVNNTLHKLHFLTKKHENSRSYLPSAMAFCISCSSTKKYFRKIETMTKASFVWEAASVYFLMTVSITGSIKRF
jgi:hypothetical protein